MPTKATVGMNPLNIRRGKMALSDLENMKRIEREHRRRLRSEQVREQSKALSKRILERTRQVEKEQLNRLHHDGNTEFNIAHNKKLMDYHRRYQDIEDIGYAHKNALKQPNVEEIKKIEEEKNKAVAQARGAEAIQRLNKSKKIVSPDLKRQQRLHAVRNLENERSCMVSNLSKKSQIISNHIVENSGNENIKTPAKRKVVKCVVSKKSPIKKIRETSVHSKQKKTPFRPTFRQSDNSNEISTAISTDKSKPCSSNKVSNLSKVSDCITDLNKINVCESDDNEPRKTVPLTSSICRKPDNIIRCNRENSISSDLSTTCTSSSISDDSSYFSDTCKTSTVKKNVIPSTLNCTSKVDLYDYTTRQRKTYDRPTGLVEKMNVKNTQNAENLAQEIIELENRKSNILEYQKQNAQQRSQDALLREKIRKDYQVLLKNLDLLSKEERKLSANKIPNVANRQVHNPSKNNKDHVRRQKKMDRAFETILRSSQDPCKSDNRPERPITITPRNYIHSNTVSTSAWKVPNYMNEQKIEESYSESDDELTRKRKISELLLKIEKLKKKLLQEYGANLPDEIFNASVKSLFNQQHTNSASQQHAVKTKTPKSKPTTPEIQVINMSSCDEAAEPVRKLANNNKKTSSAEAFSKGSTKNNSNGCVSTRDQQVQVELETTRPNEEATNKPVEPIVKILKPKNSESNSSLCSDSSIITDVVVGVNKKEITVVPKSRDNSMRSCKSARSCAKSRKYSTNKAPVKISFEQKSGNPAFEVAGLLIDADQKKITILPRRAKKASSQNGLTPCSSVKSQSLPGSRDASPANKGSKSAPVSQQCSPKKCSPCFQAELRAKEKEPCDSEQQRYRTQYTQVSIDSSTESSILNYTSEAATTAHGAGKLLKSFKSMMSKQTITTIQDSSDASTTYASPPAATPGSMINKFARVSPIINLLNTSITEAMKQQVSPVSSPETPSPRTMKLPSNVRKSDKVNKSLKFSSLVDKQRYEAPKSARRNEEKTSSTERAELMKPSPPCDERTCPKKHAELMKPSPQPDKCTCPNSTCQTLQEKTEAIQSFALHCPEILEKFEDLKNDCTERIASLTDSIQKLRNEEKGLELAMSGNEDSSSVSKAISRGYQSSGASFEKSRLVNSIEAIHNQLKMKLMESRKIIAGTRINLQKMSAPRMQYAEKSSSISSDASKDFTGTESFDEGAEMERLTKDRQVPCLSTRACAKPRIVNDERVNIKVNLLQLGRNAKRFAGGGGGRGGAAGYDGGDDGDDDDGGGGTSKKLGESTSKATGERARGEPDRIVEDMVEMLSKEILEQSKSINKSIAIDSLNDSDDSLLKSSKLEGNEPGDSEENVPANDNDRSLNLDVSVSEYVPLLAGIPKMTRPKGASGNRARPPVTLISGPYRGTEIISPAHELSTIVEFDTPDTANKSQTSNRSPSNKCRRRLTTKDGTQSKTASPSRLANEKLTKSKPSVHVAPLPAHRSPLRALQPTSSRSPRKPAGKLLNSLAKVSDSSDSLHTLPDMHIEHLQRSQDNTDANDDVRNNEMFEMHSLPDENIDRLLISDLQEESKSQSASIAPKKSEQKAQLSSSDSIISFSGLSGVSDITTTPTSDLNLFKYPSSPEETELVLKKWGLGWAIPTLKKTREASALSSSSSSDVTPVNNAARLVSPVKKQQDVTAHDLPAISDVSSISIKHVNKSTEQSVLVKGRTSTPNRLSNTNSDETASTLGSFSSDLNIVVQNQSADITVPNISFSNDKLA